MVPLCGVLFALCKNGIVHNKRCTYFHAVSNARFSEAPMGKKTKDIILNLKDNCQRKRTS